MAEVDRVPDQPTHSVLADAESTVRSHIAAERAWGEKTIVLDQALNEYWQLRESGESITPSEFADRYPTYSKSLLRLLRIDEGLEPYADAINIWPTDGDQVSDFEVLQELGRGALARVYLAREPSLGNRLVVVKVSDFGEDEARILGRLSHRHIVPVHSIQRDADKQLSAICMPYLGSTTLAQLHETLRREDNPPTQGAEILSVLAAKERVEGFCDRHRQESPPEPRVADGSYVDAVVQLGIEIASALTYTSQQGIVHRDLKPSDVLVTPSGRAMLLDFNLSCEVDQSPMLGGTLPYMSPEQIREAFLGETVASEPRSDLFSLGVILYEALSGVLPFGGTSELNSQRLETSARAFLERQENAPTPLTQLNRQVEKPLADLIHRCLETDIDERPTSPEAVMQGLREHFSIASRIRRWSSSHRAVLLFGLLIAGLMLAATGGYFATRPTLHERLHHRGLRDLLAKRYKEADANFSSVLQADPDAVGARFARCLVYLEQLRYAETINEFDLFGWEQRTPEVTECLAYAYYRHLQFTSAAAAYERAAKGASDNTMKSRCYLNQALILEKNGPQVTGRERRAWQAICSAVAASPNSPEPRKFRAQLYRKRQGYSEFGNAEQAIEDIETAITNEPPSAALYYLGALTYIQAGEELAADYSVRIRQLLELSIRNGMSDLHARRRQLRPYASQQWFKDLREKFPAAPTPQDKSKLPRHLRTLTPAPPPLQEIVIQLGVSGPERVVLP